MLENNDVIDEKYLNGKIYKITFPNTDTIYIGSTVDTLYTRLQKHKSSRNKFLSKTKYPDGTTPRNYSYYKLLNKNDDMNIELIHDYPCKNRYELESHEIDIQMTTPNICNKIVKKKNNQLYKCECGVVIVNKMKNLLDHYQTKRHVNYIIKLNRPTN